MASQEAARLLAEEEPAPDRVGALRLRLRKHWIPIAGAGALLAVVVVIAATVKGSAGTADDARALQGSTPTTSDAPEISAPNSPPALRSQAPAPADTHASTVEKETTVVTTTTTTPFTGAAQRKLFQFVENLDGTVAVRTSNGGYVSVSDGDKLGTAPAIGKHESFKLIDHPDGTISLESWTGSFIAAKGDEVKLATKKGKFEKLKKVEQEDGAVMLETADGEHVSSEAFSDERGRFAVYAREAEEAGDAEKFHVEVNSDHTASLKSLHGTYLTVEGSGSVVAGSLTVGKNERFKRKRNSDGTVSLATAHGGHYVSVFENGTVLANATKCHTSEKFQLVKQKDGSVSLKAWNGRYLSVSKLPILTFYMYRAQGNGDYPWRSVNTGNLAGVMWYLHNEVVLESPRKYGIERIIRMKFQTTSTKALAEVGLNFGVRFAYDTGMCTGAGPINGYASCRDLYARLGHFVGCNYLGDYPFPMASKGFPSFYEGGIWYSLPKEGACISAPYGGDNCTFFYEDAGSVDIGDLHDMGNGYWDWYNNPDMKEYDKDTDEGVGSDFWNGIKDVEGNKKRVQRALALFSEKYPDIPSQDAYPDPVCDFNCKKFYSSEEMEKVGGECQCSEHEAALAFMDKVSPEQCNLDATSGLQNVGYYQGN